MWLSTGLACGSQDFTETLPLKVGHGSNAHVKHWSIALKEKLQKIVKNLSVQILVIAATKD